MRLTQFSLLLSAALLSVQALAHDFNAGNIHIDHPWSRALPPVAPTGAAYLTLENQGQQSDTLLSARTPIAGHVELHEHIHQDSLMKMQQIDSVTIAPGQRVEFTPGGNHIMLFELKQPLTDGDKYPMTLIFEQAGEVDIQVVVTADPDNHGNNQPEDHGNHSEHDAHSEHSHH